MRICLGCPIILFLNRKIISKGDDAMYNAIPPFSSAADGISHFAHVIGRRRMEYSNLGNRRSLALWSRNYTLDVQSGSLVVSLPALKVAHIWVVVCGCPQPRVEWRSAIPRITSKFTSSMTDVCVGP